jgi:predicted esterase
MRSTFVHRLVPGTGSAGRTTLLLLHGTGGNEGDLLELGGLLLPGATLLSPRGKVLENGMPRFFRRSAEGVFDEEDLERHAHELADFVRDAAAAHGLDPRRVVAVGYSNGANIAGGVLSLCPEALAAAVLFRPMVPFAGRSLPDLSGKMLFVAGGRQDPIVPASETRRWIDLLRKAGATVTAHEHPGGHELGQDDVAAARAWLESLELVA